MDDAEWEDLMLVLNDEAAKIGTDDSAETRATSPIGGSTAHFEQSPFLGPSKNTFITYIQWTGTHVCVGVARRGGSLSSSLCGTVGRPAAGALLAVRLRACALRTVAVRGPTLSRALRSSASSCEGSCRRRPAAPGRGGRSSTGSGGWAPRTCCLPSWARALRRT